MRQSELDDYQHSGAACSKCGNEFNTEHGMKTHRWQVHGRDEGRPSKQTLENLYIEDGLTLAEIGEHCEVVKQTVANWMEEYGLDRRPSQSEPSPGPWNDKETLEELYIEQELSSSEIAEQWGGRVDSSTILGRLQRFGIETRDSFQGPYRRFHYNLSSPAHYRTNRNGYETWVTKVGNTQHTVRVHRLAAVAWFGFDAVIDNHVHHKKPIPWLNTEWNLQPKTPSEHMSDHAQSRLD